MNLGPELQKGHMLWVVSAGEVCQHRVRLGGCDDLGLIAGLRARQQSF
jgi:hypothetical protein